MTGHDSIANQTQFSIDKLMLLDNKSKPQLLFYNIIQ